MWFSLMDYHNKHLAANTALPVETNITLQTGVIDALSITNRDEDIPVCKMNELGPLIYKLINKGNGRLFVVTTSQGLYSKNYQETYSINEIENLQKKVYELIEDHTSAVLMSASGILPYCRSYSSIIYNDAIKEQKQQADDFIKLVQDQDKDNIEITLSYNITEEVDSNKPSQCVNIGHALGLDIRLKNNILTIIAYNSFPRLDSKGFNNINNISETLHNIHSPIKDKNISSVFLTVPLGTEEKGTDCTLHSFHFVKTSKRFAKKMEELHEGLATKNQNSISTFLTDEFPQEFFVIAQKEKNFTYLTQEIFKGKKNEAISKIIQANTIDNFLFPLHVTDKKTSGFFNSFADSTQDLMTAENHQELTELVSSLQNEKLTKGNYPFFTLKVNTTLNIELKKIIESIYNSIASTNIFSLPIKDLSKLLSITQKMFNTIHENYIHEYSNILEQTTKFYKHSTENRTEYAYKKATSLILSEEFKQIADIIPTANSIKQEAEYSDNPLEGILYALEKSSRLKLPQMLELLHQKITSQEIIEDHNKIFDEDIVFLINKILNCCEAIKTYTVSSIRLYNNHCNKQGLPIEDKVIINIGDKCFCLKEKQEAIEKIHLLVKQLSFLVSYELAEINNNQETRNSKTLASSWNRVIKYQQATQR
jgi:hypothetical protein